VEIGFEIPIPGAIRQILSAAFQRPHPLPQSVEDVSKESAPIEQENGILGHVEVQGTVVPRLFGAFHDEIPFNSGKRPGRTHIPPPLEKKPAAIRRAARKVSGNDEKIDIRGLPRIPPGDGTEENQRDEPRSKSDHPIRCRFGEYFAIRFRECGRDLETFRGERIHESDHTRGVKGKQGTFPIENERGSDHSIVRQGLKQIVSECPGMVVAGEAASGEEALDLVRKRDFNGASAYLTKAGAPDELVQAIHAVANGKRFITPSVAERLATYIEADSDRPPHEKLSDRELQVLVLLGAGKSVGDIAGELDLSVKTISTYRARLLEKMGMETTAQLIKYAVQHDLVQ
jgi:two-component system invasion response regulator UvrY